ncbi:MAG TPA: ABC transporter permease [Nitrososphaerales archaeon]|nr:ABC transporter permease [Nitrososphaerales archaeon]
MASKKFLFIFDRQESLVTLSILRSSVVTTAGLVVVIGFLVTSLVLWLTNDAILPYNPSAITSAVLQPPSLAHIFGTDSLGRDVFSRVLAAAPIDARVPIAVLSIAVSLGVLTGTVAGYFGGWIEEVIMRVTDIFLAFPGIVLALAIAAALGPNINNSILALTPVWWPFYTRLVRGETLSVKSQQYVEASRASGHKSRYIAIHHIIPNILPITLVYATLDFGTVIIVFSVLSFVGVGAQPPTPEWGLMTLNEAQYLTSAPWLPLIPAFVILLVAVGFSLLGDGLRDALDPKVRSLFG